MTTVRLSVDDVWKK